MNSQAPSLGRRFLYYGLWLSVAVALFWKPSLALIQFSLANDNASHVVVIPFIAAWLLFVERKKIFTCLFFDLPLGIGLAGLSVAIYIWTRHSASFWSSPDQLSGHITALVLLCISGFVIFFGREAAKNGRFVLLFLFFVVPVPEVPLNGIIYVLQKGSADITGLIFDLTRVPALREGFVFHLSQVNIEVAKECSGIRSSVALLILAVLFAHLFLRTFWKQALFVAAGMLIMIVKNGVRIATLTILAQYVDPGFLYGKLHQEGGVVFFLLGLVLLLPLFLLLERSDKTKRAVANTPIA